MLHSLVINLKKQNLRTTQTPMPYTSLLGQQDHSFYEKANLCQNWSCRKEPSLCVWNSNCTYKAVKMLLQIFPYFISAFPDSFFYQKVNFYQKSIKAFSLYFKWHSLSIPGAACLPACLSVLRLACASFRPCCSGLYSSIHSQNTPSMRK